MLTDLILGTAGHIDHGKSSLIKALTGIDTARLPEEKKRGITIELGYSFLELPPFRLGIVDVPGHERFVRQMLSGATGMDLALLVIAADDSIKQQTREHLDILRMLDLPAGVIALTKADLVEPDWLELVEEEIRGLVENTFLARAPIIPFSAKTLFGLDALKSALAYAATIAANSSRQLQLSSPFRMAIDRCFPVEGYGTVVTGSVGSGTLRVGDTVEIQPQGISARVRGLHNHDQIADEVHRGQRAAVNLGGIHHEQIGRGDEIAEPGHLVPSRRLFAEILMLDTAIRPLVDRTRVRVHLGTNELLGVVRLVGDGPLAPGTTGNAMITLADPCVATWGQPLVIRQESPMFTIGGGRVLHPVAPEIRKFSGEDVVQVQALASPDPTVRAGAAAWFSDAETWSHDQLARSAGIVDTAAAWNQLLQQDVMLEIRASASRNLTIHRGRFAQIQDSLRRILERMHDQNPLRLTHQMASLMAAAQHVGPSEILNAAIRQLVTDKVLIHRGQTVSLEGKGPKLTKNERLQLDEMLEQVRAAGLAAPTIAQIQKSATRSRDSIPQLVQIGVGSGDLALLGTDIVVHQQTIETVVQRLRSQYGGGKQFTVSDLREFLDTSRRYAIPLCEFLDEAGITKRNGDQREMVVPDRLAITDAEE